MALAQSAVQSLEAGESLDITLSFEVTAALNELVVSLAIDESSPAGSSFRVRETTVTMVLP